ncbi:6029_t:CDS:2 [Cetraspora pellucida]|uniref:6029_t:CDS:1 n=1 Tax=Cetraspora pellucida TaxID=1433469 RepID=A0ACA9NZI1_9GLOM|nr:6029_t:CDS:2 [Cetraspora pellucida]
MSKVNSSHSSSLSEEERSNRIPIVQQKIVLKNEPCEVIELVNNLILEFAEYNPQKNNNSKKIIGTNVPKSSKIAKERWAAIKKFNRYEYQFWQKLTEIANLKHKFLYPNYKYSPIRNKSKKCKKSNYTSYKQQPPLEANDIIKSREIESNKNTKRLQIKETQALSDYNDCQNHSTTPNLFIEPPLSLYSYITPIFHESFIPHYLSPEYKHSIAASSMMSG